MATSNDTSFELTLSEIIDAALRKCGVLEHGDTASANDLVICKQALNALLQTFVTLGMPLWKRIEVPLTLVANQNAYLQENSLKIAQVFLLNTAAGTRQELSLKSKYDLNILSSGAVGRPSSYAVEPTLTGSRVVVWPKPDAVTVAQNQLVVVYQKEFDGFFNNTDTPDFPAYWTEALIYGLAIRICPEYDVPLPKKQNLEGDFRSVLAAAQGYGDEDGSFYFQPERR